MSAPIRLPKDLPLWADLRDVLADRRKQIGVSRYQLARMLGMHESTLMRWEYGDTGPRWEELARILSRLGGTLTIEWDSEPEE